MWRISEEVATKIVKNIKNPELGLLDMDKKDPFEFTNTNSIGLIDPYAALGTDFRYVLELPQPYINPALPPIETLHGYWLYRSTELQKPEEPFIVPRYLADPNIKGLDEEMDARECAIILPSEITKLTCPLITTFEQLIAIVPDVLDCLQENLK